MFSPDSRMSQTAVEPQSYWFRWHRLAGYLLPPHVFMAAEALFSATGSHPGGPQPSTANVEGAASLLRQALVFYPMDLHLIRFVRRLHALVPATAGFDAWLRALERFYRYRPDHFVDSMAVCRQMRGEEPQRALERVCRENKAGALSAALHEFWSQGDWERVYDISCRLMNLPEAPLFAPLVAWSAWSAGERDLATQWLTRSEPPSFLTHNLRAEMAAEAGENEEAQHHWQQSLKWDPHQPHVFHRYWESHRSGSIKTTFPDRRIHIVLYTYNKLETTLSTLRSVLASEIGSSCVTILNNGSTSFCKEDLDRGIEAVAQGRRVDVLHLPVNIGAPAARNWLWHLPQVKCCDHVAFLDDDVLVPPDWLPLYLETLELWPEAVVVGPRGLNPGKLPTIQYVHRFFDQVGQHKIRFTPAAPMFHDMGQFTYRHPCLSVMGCCHLFHRGRWEALNVPDFDICFSPSQVDDLEHDLQIWKRGGQVVYDGRVAVVHLQDAGRAAPMSRAAWGHVWGNHMKLESKFTGEELEEMKRRVEEVDEAFHHRVRRDVNPILKMADLHVQF